MALNGCRNDFNVNTSVACPQGLEWRQLGLDLEFIPAYHIALRVLIDKKKKNTRENRNLISIFLRCNHVIIALVHIRHGVLAA